jgi:hypothetical protein
MRRRGGPAGGSGLQERGARGKAFAAALLGASTGAGVLACSSPGANPQAWDQELLAE